MHEQSMATSNPSQLQLVAWSSNLHPISLQVLQRHPQVHFQRTILKTFSLQVGLFLKSLLGVSSLGLWTAKECTDASTRIANPARGEGAMLCFCEHHRTRCNSKRCKPLDFLGSPMLWMLASGRLAVVSVVVYLEQP